jgi:hypothetical protein
LSLALLGFAAPSLPPTVGWLTRLIPFVLAAYGLWLALGRAIRFQSPP